MANPSGGPGEPGGSGSGRSAHLLWLGPLVGVFGLLSYFLLFSRWPFLRDLPVLNLGILALAVLVSAVGLRWAWPRGGWRRAAGGAGLVISSALAALLAWYCFVFSYTLPSSARGLALGQPFPALVLQNQDGRDVDLAGLAQGRLVLVFYRGFW